ncbi:MAG: hypothetical protein IJ587_04640 [Synergistaceae bacterium]|nr:hypothetical protein [Synergistaceae bacterium]
MFNACGFACAYVDSAGDNLLVGLRKFLKCFSLKVNDFLSAFSEKYSVLSESNAVAFTDV